MAHTYIKELAKYEGQEVVLEGWLSQKRDSKTIVFLVLRDGTGFVQCIVDINTVGEEVF
jgi:asparaginyl-tRNA synthetase